MKTQEYRNSNVLNAEQFTVMDYNLTLFCFPEKAIALPTELTGPMTWPISLNEILNLQQQLQSIHLRRRDKLIHRDSDVC
ncbi:hypothetical protein PROFUN_12668 [Planoprotostelium fungivorum]|uniref:Uncharacterized protein n=1 Tax=Planoprotostelium fungivorum TaxID=1890364 RepID=A0A2P6N705_9EUKA|nr:hypothetical protein PROFUN_12668 [Planoprotostelium fungivorum]